MASNFPDMIYKGPAGPDRTIHEFRSCECGAALEGGAEECHTCGRLIDDPDDMREHPLIGNRENDRLIDVFRAASMDAIHDESLLLDGRRWCDSPRREEDDDEASGGEEGS